MILRYIISGGVVAAKAAGASWRSLYWHPLAPFRFQGQAQDPPLLLSPAVAAALLCRPK
ncbi:hypothetical protein [Kamptonema formosum]|uniref:hypothetical protein n=1 Tax=Kamptonema formosum TaxID=331992 RepID=UPI00034DDC9B|nr:hypothetical protein [Oscillatoria sp. PCC 10802]